LEVFYREGPPPYFDFPLSILGSLTSGNIRNYLGCPVPPKLYYHALATFVFCLFAFCCFVSLCWGFNFLFVFTYVCFCCSRIVALGCLLLHFASCFCVERCLLFILFSRVSLSLRFSSLSLSVSVSLRCFAFCVFFC